MAPSVKKSAPPDHMDNISDVTMDAGDRVVISGMTGLYPDAGSVTELSNILYNKVNPVRPNNARWIYSHPEVSDCVGIVPELQLFDAQFFMVHYRLACNMDIASRKLLEQAYQAIYDAGVSPQHLYGKKVGVYIGSCLSESEKIVFYASHGRNGFGITGSSKTMFANRISYWLNSKGPSMSIDAACCSSTVALNIACRDILRGDCESAIVGGCSICLHPQTSLHYARVMKLSKDCQTKSFDKNADGCCKSEAINVLFLQKAKDALRIYAEIVHTNSEYSSLVEGEEGPRYGFCRNPADTLEFLTSFYKNANISPNHIKYVEACGSAHPEADKAELEVIEKMYCTDRKDTLLVGSVTSNVGYGEAASGITAITKVLLGYHTGALAGNLHYETPRSDVAAICDGRIRILTEPTPLQSEYTAVNQLSITGINSHVLLRGQYKRKDLSRYKSSIPHLVLISGRQESAVSKVFNSLKTHPVDPEQLALLHNIHLTRISGNLSRGFSILDKNQNGETVSLCEKVDYFDYVKRPLWFVYSGMGSQWAGMGKQLMRIPIFAAAIERCHKVLKPRGIDIVEVITTDDKTVFNNILHSFVGITAIQIGLTDILTELGLVPDKIMGHSLGETGCAYADGCFTAEEAILCAYGRGLVSVQTPLVRGAMAAVGIGYQQIVSMCPPEIEVACHNGPQSCTISGPEDIMRQFVEKLTSNKIYAKEVPSSNIAYHSRYIADAGNGLLKFLSSVIKDPKPRSDRWMSTSVPMEKWNEEFAKYSSAEYHTNNLLSPVLFEETSRLIPADAVVVEVAPHGLLQAILKRSLPSSCRNIPLTRRGHSDNVLYLLEAIGKLYIEGFDPKIQVLYPKIEFPVSTGTPMLSHLVGWAHSESWGLPLYIKPNKKTASALQYVISLHDEEHSYLKGHMARGQILYPFAAALVAVWDALCMSGGASRKSQAARLRSVSLHAAPILHARRQLRLYVTLQRGNGRFEVMDDLKSKIASGFITQDSISGLRNIEKADTSDLEITAKEIYHNFLLRDYCYKNCFQSISSANSTLTEARLHWRNNWVTFIDGLIQLNALRHPHDYYSRPFFIRNLCIDPKEHRKYTDSIMTATVLETSNLTRCGGVVMDQIQFYDIPSPIDRSLSENLNIVPGCSSDQFNGVMNGDETRNEIALVGPLDSLNWTQTSMQKGSGISVEVHYAGLNILDLKKATGLYINDGQIDKGYGMDFSGVTESGMRVMGLVQCGAARSRVAAARRLAWPVPPHWSLEDAATVPLAYCLAYYCLVCTYRQFWLTSGMSILIHGGAGALGQAFISIALAYGCEVFTTVGDVSKKQFLLKCFPSLKAKNIGNSRDLTFYDMVLAATNGEGVDLVICNLNDEELKSVSLKCSKSYGVTIDVNHIPNKCNFDFGMASLNKERTYSCVDLFSIFDKEGSEDTLKQLQNLVAEGIARGTVRPLSRVTYEPRDAARAFRLLAAGSRCGRALLRLRLHAPPALPRLQCTPEGCHIIVSDHQSFGQQLADMLVSRGARKLDLYLPWSPEYFKLKMRQLERKGVQVRYQSLDQTSNDIYKALDNTPSLEHIEGVYVCISSKNIPETKSASLVQKIDIISRKKFQNLKFFLVINSTNSAGEDTCISRIRDKYPATMLKLPELNQMEGTAGHVAAAAERALLSAAGVLRATVASPPPRSLLHQLAHRAEIIIPENTNCNTTLLELGVKPSSLNNLFVFLRDNYNIFLTTDEIQALTIQRINEINDTLTRTEFDDVQGLEALFCTWESDELLATTDIVLMHTLTTNIDMRDDDFDMGDDFLCIVPGVEGQAARFGALSSRLKLPALLLQPPLDRPNLEPRELALRNVQILLEKANLKKKFYLLGYEAGVLVALEMAVILEDKGYTGVVYCIGAPEEIRENVKDLLRAYETEEALQEAIIRHMFRLMTKDADGQGRLELEAALRAATSWGERVEAGVRGLRGRVPHSAQYARQAMRAAYARVRQLLRPPYTPAEPRARLVLLRPASRTSRTSRDSRDSRTRYAAEYALDAPLASAADDLRCAAIINAHLDADILEAFDKRNLCESYFMNSDAFVVTG